MSDVIDEWNAVPPQTKAGFDLEVEADIIGPGPDSYEELQQALDGLTLAAENGELITKRKLSELIRGFKPSSDHVSLDYQERLRDGDHCPTCPVAYEAGWLDAFRHLCRVLSMPRP